MHRSLSISLQEMSTVDATLSRSIGLTHDNTTANKANPDPNQWVGWGERTVDEMAHAWVNITYMSDDDYRAEIAKRKTQSSTVAQR